MMPYAYDSFNMLVQGFESGQEILAYVRGMTEYDGTAGKITKKAGTGNFRSAPAVWVIKNGRPALAGLFGHPMVPDELAIAGLALQNRPPLPRGAASTSVPALWRGPPGPGCCGSFAKRAWPSATAPRWWWTRDLGRPPARRRQPLMN